MTAGLKARLLRFDPASSRVVKEELDPGEAHTTLARHIEEVVARALNGLPPENRDRVLSRGLTTNSSTSIRATFLRVGGSGVGRYGHRSSDGPARIRTKRCVHRCRKGEIAIIRPVLIMAKDTVTPGRGHFFIIMPPPPIIC